jgi:steroid 5-alpha reductase family enzyme
MEFLSIYLILGLIILGLMTLLWLISLALKNSSIVDIFWGTGFVIVTWAAFLLTPEGFLPRKLLLNLFVTIWGCGCHFTFWCAIGENPKIFAIRPGAKKPAQPGGGAVSLRFFSCKE